MTNAQAQMTNQIKNPNSQRVYDLEERTAQFGEKVIDFANKLPRTVILAPLVTQLVRAATSIGANYVEADAASSKKDFKFKITLCRKEAKETRHWLRMITHAVSQNIDEARTLSREAQELVLIFSAILK